MIGARPKPAEAPTEDPKPPEAAAEPAMTAAAAATAAEETPIGARRRPAFATSAQIHTSLIFPEQRSDMGFLLAS